MPETNRQPPRMHRALRVALVVIALACVASLVVAWAISRSSYGPEFKILFSDPLPLDHTELPALPLGTYPTARPGPSSLTEADRALLATTWAPRLVDYPGATDATNPVSTSLEALDSYDRYIRTGDERFVERTISAADWLIENQASDGAWRYAFAFHDLEPGWVSAMAQGMGVSVLLRAHQETDEVRYLEAATAAYGFMNLPEDDGGTVSDAGGMEMYEEYPGSEWGERVLNGSIFALFGADEYARVVDDPDARDRADVMANNLAGLLGKYDTGWWSRYGLSEENAKASPSYHHLHVRQLEAMARLTGDARWQARAEAWREYAGDNRFEFMWCELIDKLR